MNANLGWWTRVDDPAGNWKQANAAWFRHQGEWLQVFGEATEDPVSDPDLWKMVHIKWTGIALTGLEFCAGDEGNWHYKCVGTLEQHIGSDGVVLMESTKHSQQIQGTWEYDVPSINIADLGTWLTQNVSDGRGWDMSDARFEATNTYGDWVCRGYVRNYQPLVTCVLVVDEVNPTLPPPDTIPYWKYEWGCTPDITEEFYLRPEDPQRGNYVPNKKP